MFVVDRIKGLAATTVLFEKEREREEEGNRMKFIAFFKKKSRKAERTMRERVFAED
jgi:hypothetical protein